MADANHSTHIYVGLGGENPLVVGAEGPALDQEIGERGPSVGGAGKLRESFRHRFVQVDHAVPGQQDGKGSRDQGFGQGRKVIDGLLPRLVAAGKKTGMADGTAIDKTPSAGNDPACPRNVACLDLRLQVLPE